MRSAHATAPRSTPTTPETPSTIGRSGRHARRGGRPMALQHRWPGTPPLHARRVADGTSVEQRRRGRGRRARTTKWPRGNADAEPPAPTSPLSRRRSVRGGAQYAPASVSALVTAACGVFGLVVGSFLNVVIYRVPRKESVVRPRSRCPGCGTQLAERDNIPVVSWLVLRGRCRTCR